METPVIACGGPIKAKDAPWWLAAWMSNGDLIAAVARLGYLDGDVLDATYGRGTFWKVHRPASLVANDRDVEVPGYRFDYRQFPPEWEHKFDAVVFDPDYKLNGTPALGEFDERYGIGGDVSREQRYASILHGAAECARVSRRFLLVKCQDQVESGRQWWMGDDVTARMAGWTKVEEFMYLGGGRPQPKDRDKKCDACGGIGRWIDGHNERPCAACAESGRVPSVQQHAHARPSKLLIFKRPGRTR
jgi:hypothetical protein